MSMADNDGLARLRELLTRYGLEGLTTWAWDQLVQGRSEAEIALSLTERPEYQQRFGTVIDARRAAGLPAVSAAEILNYESSWSQIAGAGGLPESFRGRDVAQRLMAADVSASEANDRVQRGYIEVRNAPVAVREAFQVFFGAQGDAALAALFLDAEVAMPALERMVGTAQVSGAGAQQGFGVGQGLAGELAAGGIGYSQAQAGFSQLAEERALFDETISETSDLTTEQGVRGTFGLSGEDAEKKRKRAERRRADTGGGYSSLEGQGGTGLGSARQT